MAISSIILAGGRAQRMQGIDKGLVSYRNRPLIEHVLERIRPQVDQIIISANRNRDKYAAYSDHVIADKHPGFSGPLAGLASCLPYCQHPLTLVVACDMPNLPADLVSGLIESIDQHELAIVSCAARLQLAFLLRTRLADSIQASLEKHEYKLMDWINTRDLRQIPCVDEADFINLNSAYELNAVS